MSADHADCPVCRPRTRTPGPIPGTADVPGPAAPADLPSVADVTALPTVMCAAEDDDRELGCSLPAGHAGPHLDYTAVLTGDNPAGQPDVFLTPDQYEEHRANDPGDPDLPPPGSTWDGATTAPGILEALPSTLTDGLTVWGPYGGAQIRLESTLLADDAGELLLDDAGGVQLAPIPPIGCLYLAFNDNAPRSTEDGQPYRLGLIEARALRDLLNTATARGAL